MFNPADTTFVTHFMGHTAYYQQFGGGGPFGVVYAGYMLIPQVLLNAIQFKMSSGNIDSGTIKLYGIK